MRFSLERVSPQYPQKALPRNSLMDVITYSQYPNFSPYLVKFVQLFNILYDENINPMLEKTTLEEPKILNWNKINAVIFFNYLQ